MPLPSTSLLGFSAPVVKAGELVLPVLVRGERHGLRISVPMARDIAQAILAATEPDALTQGQVPVASGKGPIFKPAGQLL